MHGWRKGTPVLEQELVDLTEYSGISGRLAHGGRGYDWSLLTAVWDSRERKLLGYLRMESLGGTEGLDIVTELEEAPFALQSFWP